MTPELRATLESWLASPDPVLRRAARWRLSVTDAELADAARAARLIAEFPPGAQPAPGDRQPCCNGASA
jgi:hypothetical protein